MDVRQQVENDNSDLVSSSKSNLLSSLECELKVLFPVLFAQFVKIKRLQNINILDLLEVF